MGVVLSCGCLGKSPEGSSPTGTDDNAPEQLPWDANGGLVVEERPDGLSIEEAYDMQDAVIGTGSFGSVCSATSRETKYRRAVKAVRKTSPEMMKVLAREIAILEDMDHPNIVKLFDKYEDHRMVYLVMELCEGGELFDRIIEADFFTEEQAALLMQQILHAVNYMHGRGVCHRDLKPENFLLQTTKPIEENVLKLIDFGISRKVVNGGKLNTVAGTAYYVAPEVLSGSYDQRSDLWSCGVLMYVFLCGYPPFSGADNQEVFKQVQRGHVHYRASDWSRVSSAARDLVRRLLTVSPERRISSQDALEHSWVKDKAPGHRAVLGTDILGRLRDFRSQNRLRKAALQVIARHLDEGEIASLREAFISLDTNGDGILSVDELAQGVRKSGLEEVPPDLDELLDSASLAGGSHVNYTEFLATVLSHRQSLLEDACWAAFRVFDRNGDGKISRKELHMALSTDAGDTPGDWDKVLAELDANDDGSIDFEEFLAMMQSRTSGEGRSRPRMLAAAKSVRAVVRLQAGLGAAPEPMNLPHAVCE